MKRLVDESSKVISVDDCGGLDAALAELRRLANGETAVRSDNGWSGSKSGGRMGHEARKGSDSSLAASQLKEVEVIDLSRRVYDKGDKLKTMNLGFEWAVFSSLRRLDLSGNALSTVSGLGDGDHSGNLNGVYGGLESTKTGSNDSGLRHKRRARPLRSLVQLSLAHNSFKLLDRSCFSSLHALQRLDLSGNFFQHIPKALSSLGALRWLDLSGNNLLQLRELRKLQGLANLSWLFLTANPLASLQHYRLFAVHTL